MNAADKPVLPAELRKVPLTERSMAVWTLVASERRGAHFTALKQSMGPGVESQQLRDTLKSLRESGYIVYKGEGRWGLWNITDRSPIGVALPPWKMEQLYATDGAEQAQDDAVDSERLNGLPPGVPNSVFALGKPAPAPQAGINIDAVHTEPPAAKPQARFSLCSDGVFTIEHGNAEPISLPPSVTRAMFRWLDRLGGVQLQSTLEAQP